jgi:hypothetical protein
VRILTISLLALTLFLIPLLVPVSGLGYEEVKVFAFLGFVILSGFIFVYNLGTKKLKIRWTKLKIAGLIFVSMLGLSSIAGIDPLGSLTGKYPYYQGVILYFFLYFFFLIVSESDIEVSLVRKAVVFSGVVVSIVAIYQFLKINVFNIETFNYAGRVVSTFGQPNLYSGFLLLALPLASKEKYRIVIFFILAVGIALSLSKTVIVLTLCLGAYWIYKKLRLGGWAIFLGLFILLNLILLSVEKSEGVVWDEFIGPLAESRIEDNHKVEKRIFILPGIIAGASNNLVLGFGLDSIAMVYSRQFENFKPEFRDYPPRYFNLMNLNVDRSHNYLIDLLVFSGLLGLGTYLWLWILLFKSKSSGNLKLFLIYYLVWVQFQPQSIVHLMLFWLIAGLIDKRKKLSDDEF